MKETLAIREGIAKLSAQGRVVSHPRSVHVMPEVLPDISESEFQRQVIYYATRQGWRYHHHYDSRRSVAGWPDLVLVRGDRLVFAELKATAGRLTADQSNWIDDLRRAGQTVFVWRPADWPAIMETLE